MTVRLAKGAAGPGDGAGATEIVSLGCRLNAFEAEVMRWPGPRAR